MKSVIESQSKNPTGLLVPMSPCRAGIQGHEVACQHCLGNALQGEWQTVYTGEEESKDGHEDWFCCHVCRDADLPCETFHRIPINDESQENTVMPKTIFEHSAKSDCEVEIPERPRVQYSFDEISQLLRESYSVMLNSFPVVQLEFESTSFYVRRRGLPEYTFNEDAASEATFYGTHLLMPDAQGFICVFNLGSVDAVYLANATGDCTGDGTLDVSNEDLMKVPFESGPGVVLPYLTEIAGKKYVQGNLEVAFDHEFWGEDARNFSAEEAVREYCEAVQEFIRQRLVSGALLLPFDERSPGRFIVQVAIPIDSVTDREDARTKLCTIYGTAADLANERDLA